MDRSSQTWVHVTSSSVSAQSSAQSSSEASFGAAQTSGRPDDEELGALRRVVAIGRTERAGEGELTLLTLELYERGFVATSRLRWPGPFGLFPELGSARRASYLAVTKKPALWRAGVAWVGITDLIRMYGQSMEHFKYFLREQMGDPERDAALWADRSAINFAQDLRAKLLIVHGTTDPRCPVSQARVFRDRLLELGRNEGEDFEYVEFGDEGHGSSDIEQKIRTYKLLAEYLERTL